MWGKLVTFARSTQTQFEETMDTIAQSTQVLVNEAKEGGVTGLVEKAKGFVEQQKQEVFGDLKKLDIKRRQRESLERKISEAQPPWAVQSKDNKDTSVEEDLKRRILKLTKDQTNFIAKAPDSSVFSFDMKAATPYATKAIELDVDLRKLRFKLVPQKVPETEFWRNYFYRVSLIREQLSVEPLNLSSEAKIVSDENKAVDEEANGKEDGGVNKDKVKSLGTATSVQPAQNQTLNQDEEDFDHPDVNNLSDDIKEKLRKELKLTSPPSAENNTEEINMENINEMLEGVPGSESEGDDIVDVDVDAMLKEERWWNRWRGRRKWWRRRVLPGHCGTKCRKKGLKRVHLRILGVLHKELLPNLITSPRIKATNIHMRSFW